jgi:hypothetical protein
LVYTGNRGLLFLGDEIGCFVKVQELTTCDATPTNPPITFTQYNNFCWKDLASTTVQGTVPSAQLEQANTYTYQGTLTFTLDAPSDVIQIVVDYWLGDTQQGYPLEAPGCVAGAQGCTFAPLESAFALGPIVVQIQPTAQVQLYVLPVAIIYQPPGGDSYQNYGTETQVQTAVKVGTTSTQTAITEWDTSRSVAVTANLGAAPIPNLANVTSTQYWKTQTQNLTSIQTSASDSQIITYDAGTTWKTAQNNSSAGTGDPNMLIPGYEPFWDDIFMLAPYPQLNFWDINGQWLEEVSAADLSDAFPLSVTDIAACATGTGYTAPAALWVNQSRPLTLDANDCASLLGLDPFYSWGQSAGPVDFVPVGPQAIPPLLSFAPSSLTSGEELQIDGVSNTFQTSLTDTIGSQITAGLNISIPFIGGVGVQIQNGESTSNTTKMSLTYDYQIDQ